MDKQIDRIDRISDLWSAQYPGMKTGPWQIWGRIYRVNDKFLSQAGKVLEPFDLTYNEFQTLGALVLLDDATTPKNLAAFSLLTSGGTANLLSRLERKTLITRSKGVRDKREVIVGLTASGRSLFQQALEAINKVEHALITGLNGEERLQLMALLRKLTLDLEQ